MDRSAGAGGPSAASERLVVGRVVRAHGLHGEVSVEVVGDAPGRFERGARLFVGDPASDPPERVVASSRPGPKGLLVRFEDVRDRTAAEALRDALLSVDPAGSPPPPEGRFYAHQIEGCSAEDEEGNALGTIVDVLSSPAGDLWVVEHEGREVLVPAVSEFVRAVDVEARRVVIRPIPGLFD